MRVISNTAISLDGRIATRDGARLRLGTRVDLAYMSVLRARADAVLVGGRTFRSWPVPLVAEPASIASLRESGFPDAEAPPVEARSWWNVVMTRTLDLPLVGRFWDDARVQPLVISQTHGSLPRGELVVGDTSVVFVLDHLRNRGVHTLLLECGGDLLFQFLAADAVDELYVTVCPMIVGGQGAPSLADGAGFRTDTLRRFHLAHAHRFGDELYLRYVR